MVVFLGKQPVFESKHLLTYCTLRLGGGGRATARARAPTPSRPTCHRFPRYPRLRERPRALGAPRALAFIHGAGAEAGPARGATVVGANWGGGGGASTAQSTEPAGSAFSEALGFPRNHFCMSGAPLSPFLFTPGAAGEGAAPRMAGVLGRPPKVKEAGGARIILGVSFRFGAPLSQARVQGRPECHLQRLEFRSKGRSQSFVLNDNHLQPALLDGGRPPENCAGNLGNQGSRERWGWDSPRKAPHYLFPCVPRAVRSRTEPVPILSRRWERGALSEGLSLRAAQLHTCGHVYRTLSPVWLLKDLGKPWGRDKNF